MRTAVQSVSNRVHLHSEKVPEEEYSRALATERTGSESKVVKEWDSKVNEKYTNTLTAGNCFLPGGLLGYQIVPLHMFGPMLPISWIVICQRTKTFII